MNVVPGVKLHAAALGGLVLGLLLLACADAAPLAKIRVAQPAIELPHGSAAVPFCRVGGRIILKARLDGQGPFRFMLDTCSANAVGPTVARALGSGTAASLMVNEVALGSALLRRQRFDVRDFPSVAPGRLDGVLGRGLLESVAARVDFAHRELTLLDPQVFLYQGPGAVVPIYFEAGQPLVNGAVDGTTTRFRVDTGEPGSLRLDDTFARNHRAGASKERPIRHLYLEDVDVRDVTARTDGISPYDTGTRPGASSLHGFAGDLGNGVWQRFTLLLDFPGRVLILETSAGATPDTRP